MKHVQTHFANTGKPPIGSFETIGGATSIIHQSICGTPTENTTTDVRQVTCLLCMRSILAVFRRHAIDFGSKNPHLTKSLFPEISREIKNRK